MTATFVLLLSALAADAEPRPPKLPHLAPAEPAAATRTFRIKEGFRLELAAVEPLVVDPIAMSFDENGRLFVVEMRDYSVRRADRIGRVRMLVDTDGDGRFDRASVFADGLSWPTAVFWANGGVFVVATPDLLFFEDTDGDGQADERRVLFTGFGGPLSADQLNVQGLPNSLVWGLDNRIHGATSGNGGEVVALAQGAGDALSLRGRDFVLDPRTLTMTSENGGGQHGLSFDDFGRKFVCSNARHLMAFAYGAHYVGLNPHFSLAPPLLDIAIDGPAAEVFRRSPDEAWRVFRSRMRASGFFGAHVEGGGRPSGYFTAASGVTIYRGNALGKELVGDAFIAEPAGNLIHRKKVRPAGPLLAAERPADERKMEFVASTDGWFRPVQFANAPDGTLYVADMYREIVEHPSSLPDDVRRQFDLRNGNDRGRIWRIVPEGFRRPPPVRLGAARTAALVKTLEHPNGWHRDTAARLLYERQDRSAVPLLVDLQRRSPSPLGRLHALHALEGLGALAEPHVLRALADASAGVRVHGVRLSERFLRAGVPSAALWTRLRPLAADPAIGVRYQLALTAGLIRHSKKTEALLAILGRDVEHEWSRAAVLNALTSDAGELFAEVSRSPQQRTAGGRELLQQLAALIGARNDPAEVGRVVAFIDRLSASPSASDAPLAFSMARALADGLGRAGSSIAAAGFDVTPLLSRAKAVAAQPSTPDEASRLRAVELLGLAAYAEAAAMLLPLVDSAQPEPVQLAALATLDRFTGARDLAPALIARLPLLTPRPRTVAIDLLARQPLRAMAFLKGIEAGAVSRSAVTHAQMRLLHAHSDPSVRTLAARVLDAPVTARRDVIRRFATALDLKGDSPHGKDLFEQRCVSCHRIKQIGHTLGPDLAAARAAGREALMNSILDPNRDVMPQYLAYVVDTVDRSTLVGVVVAESAAAVTLRQAFGVETTIPRAQIKAMRSEGASLMPEGLEEGLQPQDLADLLEFIATTQD